MAENSGGTPDQESTLTTWQCIHCGVQVSRMAAGYVIKECFMCGKAQIMCVNPDCKEPFEKEMDKCSKCHTPQRQPPESSPMEVQILCINPDCKAHLDSVNSEICMKCSAPQQVKQEEKQPPSKPQTTCSSPDCKEPVDSSETKFCSKCNALQKEQSMEAQMVCVNPTCKEPLPNKEAKVCSKCKAPQTVCINPECKTPLFTLTQGICHECYLSQSSNPQNISASVNEKATGGDPGNKADDSSQPPGKPMEAETSSTATFQPPVSLESSVDKNDPDTTAMSDPVVKVDDASPKVKENERTADSSQKPTVTATSMESKKSGQPPEGDGAVSQTDKTHGTKLDTRSLSCESSMTSDSDESSDTDGFRTPPHSRAEMITDHPLSDRNGDKKETPDKGGATSVAVSQIDLKRLTLKHHRDQSESDESTPSKRRASKDEEPQLSPNAMKSIKAGEHAKVEKQPGKNGTEKVDAHKGSGQKSDGERSGVQDKGGAGSTAEVYTHMVHIIIIMNGDSKTILWYPGLSRVFECRREIFS